MHWQTKAVIQSVLARIPFGEQINHRLQSANPAREANEANRPLVITTSLNNLAALCPIKDATVVEVGTGWDAMPTLYLSALGAKHIHTYDHLPHLRLNMAVKAIASLRPFVPESAELSALGECTELEDLLRRGRVTYRAPGDATRTGLPDASVDIYFSYAVLEHVREAIAGAIVAEAKRVLRPGGVFFAVIGLHDHYVGYNGASKVNFLRYPEWLWALLVKNKFSYHNRLRERDFLEILKKNGADILSVDSETDPSDLAEIRTMKIDKRFSGYSPEELAVTRTEIAASF